MIKNKLPQSSLFFSYCFLIPVLLMTIHFNSFGQSNIGSIANSEPFTVSGKVVSANDNEVLIGVNIIEKGTNNGVVTDFDGNYSIDVFGPNVLTPETNDTT